MTYTPPKPIGRPFVKGELVDVCDRDLVPMSVHKVVYAGKRIVRTDCGRRWRASDGWWVGEEAYPFPSNSPQQAEGDCMNMDYDPIIAPHPPNDGKRYDCQCARCGSSMDWQRCEECDHGVIDDDDVWAEQCDVCDGRGGWQCCLSSISWCNANPLPGREQIERGAIEWFEDTTP